MKIHDLFIHYKTNDLYIIDDIKLEHGTNVVYYRKIGNPDNTTYTRLQKEFDGNIKVLNTEDGTVKVIRRFYYVGNLQENSDIENNIFIIHRVVKS